MAGPLENARTEALRSYAVTTVRRSWQHLAASVGMCAAILGWYAKRGAPRSALVWVTGMGALLVIYNIIRIGRARDALREPARLAVFDAEQRRSARVRGRIYLAAAPVVVVISWIAILVSPRQPMDSWVVVVGSTLFLAGAWIGWFRALRRLA